MTGLLAVRLAFHRVEEHLQTHYQMLGVLIEQTQAIHSVSVQTREDVERIRALLEKSDSTQIPYRPIAYVSAVWEPLQSYRTAIVQVLRDERYEVISDQMDMLPGIGRSERIARCDLFIGLFAHDGGALPAAPPGKLPLPLLELAYATSTFRRSLIFVAKAGDQALELRTHEPPPQLTVEPEPPEPAPDSRWLRRLFWTLWFSMKGNLTPAELDRAARQRHKRDVAEWRRRQEQHRTAYREACARYEERVNLQQKVLPQQLAHFERHMFGSVEDLTDKIRRISRRGPAVMIGQFSYEAVLTRWGAWARYAANSLWEDWLGRGTDQLSSPLETGALDTFLRYRWHDEAARLAQAVVAATADVAASQLFAQADPSLFVAYRSCPECRARVYDDVCNDLLRWIAQDRAQTWSETLFDWLKQGYRPSYHRALRAKLDVEGA